MLFFKTGDLLISLQKSIIKELQSQNLKLWYVMFVKILTQNIIMSLKSKMCSFKYVLIVLIMIFIHSQLKKQSLRKFYMKII